MWQIIIDTPRRYALMRAHTATHLLHAALSEIFPQTKQAGSYVWEDELRFDFFAERLLDAKEIEDINNKSNPNNQSNESHGDQKLTFMMEDVQIWDLIKTIFKLVFC